MAQSKSFNGLILSLLIYLPTCAFMPSWLYIIAILFGIYLNLDFLKNYFGELRKYRIIDKSFTALLIFALVIFIVRLIDFSQWEGIKDIYSFAYLFPFTYLVARTIKKDEISIIRFLIYFVSIEAIVAILEYIYGASTFFTSLKMYREFEDYNTLYYTRVFGLSENSSGLSLKLFLGLLLLGFTTFKNSTKYILEVLLLVASVLVFGRITLIAIPFYYLLRIFYSILTKNVSKNKLSFLPFFVYVLFFVVNPNWTQNQFTRYNMPVAEDSHESELIANNNLNGENNQGVFFNPEIETELQEEDKDLTELVGVDKINMAGRNKIWNHYFEFIKENLLLGNYGKKYLMNQKVHSHNSFLEIFASFGLVLGLVLVLIFTININLKNFYYVIPILVISLGQYFIFWGISFFDIIFYYFILFKAKSLNEK